MTSRSCLQETTGRRRRPREARGDTRVPTTPLAERLGPRCCLPCPGAVLGDFVGEGVDFVLQFLRGGRVGEFAARDDGVPVEAAGLHALDEEVVGGADLEEPLVGFVAVVGVFVGVIEERLAVIGLLDVGRRREAALGEAEDLVQGGEALDAGLRAEVRRPLVLLARLLLFVGRAAPRLLLLVGGVRDGRREERTLGLAVADLVAVLAPRERAVALRVAVLLADVAVRARIVRESDGLVVRVVVVVVRDAAAAARRLLLRQAPLLRGGLVLLGGLAARALCGGVLELSFEIREPPLERVELARVVEQNRLDLGRGARLGRRRLADDAVGARLADAARRRVNERALLLVLVARRTLLHRPRPGVAR
mmetsp:Transcript_5061/g.20782  ORF Transcript_5061/g.20782 Transcript_5061/m.20782 type:complete len:365 (+) Transcript_5061:67-1161(+)